MKELEEIRKCGMKNFRNIQVDEANLLTWQGLIVPDNPPYDKGAFRIEINFPAEYPFKPPKIISSGINAEYGVPRTRQHGPRSHQNRKESGPGHH